MKVIVTLEDTPEGVTLEADAYHTGCNDGTERSLAYLILLQIEQRIREMDKRGVLHVTDATNSSH